jgi:hypothetical protein
LCWKFLDSTLELASKFDTISLQQIFKLSVATAARFLSTSMVGGNSIITQRRQEETRWCWRRMFFCATFFLQGKILPWKQSVQGIGKVVVGVPRLKHLVGQSIGSRCINNVLPNSAPKLLPCADNNNNI